ncbi:tryptophan-rich sensory protein [Candidatus Pacearchaeota archaeon]|nr:tryptophan-rich sensory protein [Candidatus Pacearchaeota archaeon]
MKRSAKKKEKSKINYKVLIISFLIVIIVAGIGSQFTSSQVNSSWYQETKPSITPPNFVFPIAWTILFFLLALSLYYSWTNSNSNQKVVLAASFGLNFFFNICWSIFYFGLKNPGFALFDLISLWLSIILMIKVTYKIDKKASWLLVPYLLWVSFAGILNYLSI